MSTIKLEFGINLFWLILLLATLSFLDFLIALKYIVIYRIAVFGVKFKRLSNMLKLFYCWTNQIIKYESCENTNYRMYWLVSCCLTFTIIMVFQNYGFILNILNIWLHPAPFGYLSGSWTCILSLWIKYIGS